MFPFGANILSGQTTTNFSARFLKLELSKNLELFLEEETKTRIVIPRIETVAKMPKVNQKINLRISADLSVTNPRFILHF